MTMTGTPPTVMTTEISVLLAKGGRRLVGVGESGGWCRVDVDLLSMTMVMMVVMIMVVVMIEKVVLRM